MDLTQVSELKKLLVQHGFEPTKRHGQHFLCHGGVVSAISKRVQDCKGILEVGPGPGVLTHQLSLSHPVAAVEIDERAVACLADSAPTAKVILGDALKINLEEVLLSLPAPRAVVSNMPYNITGPLLTSFAELRQHYEKAVLMMQKEVGDRLRAKTGHRDVGSLTVFLQTRFEIHHVVDVPPSAFWPPPKVDSVVFELTPKVLTWTHAEDLLHQRVVRFAFTQPRKTLVNNLVAGGFTKADVLDWISQQGFSEQVRPHEVPLEHWVSLTQGLRS